MCGLVGLMTEKIMLSDHLKFKDLMVLAQLRGEEGSGLIAIPKKKPVTDIRVRKTTWSSGHLVTTSDYDEAVKGDCTILIGHARQPTKGGTTKQSVHPHRFKHITLVHNGTMSHVNGKHVPPGSSDSAAVAQAIAEQGLKTFVQESFGAYCLIWVDSHEQTLNFIRNSERPLSMAWEKVSTMPGGTRSHLWWASEQWMIPIAMSRYAGYNKDRMEYFSLPVNEHWKFPLEVPFSLKEAEIEKVEKVYKTSVVDYTGYEEWWGGRQSHYPLIPRGTNENNANSGENKNADGELPLPGFRYTPPAQRHTLSPASVLQRSAADAALATAKAKSSAINSERKESTVSPDTFRPKAVVGASHDPQAMAQLRTSFEDYRCKNAGTVRSLVRHAPCVWCSNRPSLVSAIPPNIYPVRFTETRGEYVCETCITDLDVQRMVGIG